LRWEGLKRVEKDFDLLGIESLSMPSNSHGLGINLISPGEDLLDRERCYTDKNIVGFFQ